MKISDIKAAKAGDVLRDSVVAGLQCRVFDNSRSFYLYFRTRAGVQRKPKIGDWPTITIEQARQIAKGWLAEVHQGRDPSKERKESLTAPTMAALHQRYMAQHAGKKKSGKADDDLFRLHLLPAMRSMRVAAVTTHDIDSFMRKRAAIPIQANRCFSLLSKAFNLSIRWGWRQDNPAKGAERYPEKGRKRYLNTDEYLRLSEALTTLEAESPGGVAAIRLMLLTGARLGEIVRSKRAWLRNGILYLPDSKTGEKEIHIPTAALDIINATLPVDGWLCGISSRPTKVWNKARKMAGVPDLHIHDLRHSFASQALAAGMTLPQIGELLGHTSPVTTKRYAHLEDQIKAKAAQAVADRIISRMG